MKIQTDTWTLLVSVYPIGFLQLLYVLFYLLKVFSYSFMNSINSGQSIQSNFKWLPIQTNLSLSSGVLKTFKPSINSAIVANEPLIHKCIYLFVFDCAFLHIVLMDLLRLNHSVAMSTEWHRYWTWNKITTRNVTMKQIVICIWTYFILTVRFLTFSIHFYALFFTSQAMKKKRFFSIII